ncbi:MAG: alcohol dehydrogenase catalytic domain-containing protein [Proteobacteria bacterium]|nr:alcohol dehydrogenase catalytic domain-containing protein [Pseudomonadota bacterium]
MKAAVFVEKGKPLELRDVAVPQPGPGQIRVRVKACGVCGSDLHASEADWTPRDIIMGHEFAGFVDATGPGVTRWLPGDRVVPLAQISCGRCPACLANNSSACENLELTDYNPDSGGAYAEFTIVGELDAIAMPEGLDFDEAAAIEPLAVGLDAARRARITAADSILVIGAGPIGLTVTQWARFFGARDIVVAELNPARLEVARRLGATAAIEVTQDTDIATAFEELTGRKPSLIFEAVGAPGMIQRCIDMAKRDSRIVIVGVCQQADSFEPKDCILKALQLIFAYGYTNDDYAYIVELLGARRILAAPLISHRVSLQELPAEFEALRNPTDQIKVIVRP